MQRLNQRGCIYVGSPAANHRRCSCTRWSEQVAARVMAWLRCAAGLKASCCYVGAILICRFAPLRILASTGSCSASHAPSHPRQSQQASRQTAAHGVLQCAGMQCSFVRMQQTAASGTCLPALTSRAPGRMWAMNLQSIMPRVPGVSGSSTTTTSAVGSTVSSSARRAGRSVGHG